MKRILLVFVFALSLSAESAWPEIGNPNPPYGGNTFADWFYAQMYTFYNSFFGY